MENPPQKNTVKLQKQQWEKQGHQRYRQQRQSR